MAEQSKSKSQSSNKGSLTGWVLTVFLLETIFAITFIGAEDIRQTAITETQWAASLYGTRSANWMVSQADGLYQKLILDTNLQSGVQDFYTDADIEAAREGGLGNARKIFFSWMVGRTTALFYGLQGFFRRVFGMLVWLPALGVMTVAAILDAGKQRRCRQYSFEYSNPVILGWAKRTIPSMIAASATICGVPFPLPPALPVVFLVVAVFAIHRGLHHLPKT